MKVLLKQKEEKGEKRVDKQLLYFITFMYSISTGEASAVDIFNIAKNSSYGYYTKIIGDVYILAIGWKYGLANACEIISNNIRKKNLLASQLMMKIAQVLRLGEKLSFFFKHEFEVTMKLYSAEYDRRIESMKMLMSIYSAIASTSTFMIAASMLMVILSGQDGDLVMILVTASIMLGLGVFVYIMHIIFPRDVLLNEKGNIMALYWRLFYLSIASSIGIALSLIMLNILEPLLAISIAGIPLIILGFIARKIENKVLNMNNWYPTFIRQFCEIYSTVGSLGNTLRSTLKNDFGELSKQLRAMLNRIDNRVTVEKAFELLSIESGNAIITACNSIVSTAIVKGANMSIVGNVISDVTIMLNESYNKRIQVAKVFESTLLIMHILSLAVLSFMSTLTILFSNMFSTNTIDIIDMGLIDPKTIDLLMPIIVVVVSIINGFATKVARGGSYKTVWFNIGLFMSIGAVTVYGADMFMSELLKGVMNISFNDLI